MTRYTPQWLQAGTYPASLDRRLIGALWPTAACSGCLVQAGAGMSVNVNAGQVAVPTQNNSGSTLCSSDAVEVVNIAASPPSGSNRIDVVICQPRGNDLDGGANTDFIFTTLQGAVASSPVAPAVPAGAVGLAQVYVGGGVASIVAGNITDVRPSGLQVTIPVTMPRGVLGFATGPAVQIDATTGSTVCTLANIPVVTGRRYKFTCLINGTQITAAGSPRSTIGLTGPIALDNPINNFVSYETSVASGANLMRHGVFPATASGTGLITATLVAAAASGGGYRIPINSAQILCEDTGST